MTEVHVMMTDAAPMPSLAYEDAEEWAFDMTHGLYVRLGNGNEVTINPMFIFAVTIINEEKRDDKGRT